MHVWHGLACTYKSKVIKALALNQNQDEYYRQNTANKPIIIIQSSLWITLKDIELKYFILYAVMHSQYMLRNALFFFFHDIHIPGSLFIQSGVYPQIITALTISIFRGHKKKCQVLMSVFRFTIQNLPNIQ